MDYSPNRFLSLWVVLFLTWESHIYTCCNFLLNILNIFCELIGHIFWELFENPSIHPDITDIMNQTRANRTLDQVRDSQETQKSDRNLAPIPTNPAGDNPTQVSILQNPEVLIPWYLKLRENACNVPFRRCRVVTSTFRNRCSIDGMFFLYGVKTKQLRFNSLEVW
jgi:hypothetical protein